jgi:hypothetical protein
MHDSPKEMLSFSQTLKIFLVEIVSVEKEVSVCGNLTNKY